MRIICGILAVVAFLPTPGWSVTLDEQLACSGTAHDFVTQLADEHSIQTPAQRVEANSVNAFRPASGANLTAFGLPVHAVFGYQPDDPLFKVGNGQAAEGPIYGAVVRGSADTVKRLLADAGSTAVVHSVIPLVLTAIVCKQSSNGSITRSQVGTVREVQ